MSGGGSVDQNTREEQDAEHVDQIRLLHDPAIVHERQGDADCEPREGAQDLTHDLYVPETLGTDRGAHDEHTEDVQHDHIEDEPEIIMFKIVIKPHKSTLL